MSISYDGVTLLPNLVRQGRWLRWLRESSRLIRSGNMRPRSVLVQSFGPYMPLFLWDMAFNKTFRGVSSDPTSYAALRPERLGGAGSASAPRLARTRARPALSPPYGRLRNARLWVTLAASTWAGNYNKGTAFRGLGRRPARSDRRPAPDRILPVGAGGAIPGARREQGSAGAAGLRRSPAARGHRDARNKGLSGGRLA